MELENEQNTHKFCALFKKKKQRNNARRSTTKSHGKGGHGHGPYLQTEKF